jgi:hypothetical protein
MKLSLQYFEDNNNLTVFNIDNDQAYFSNVIFFVWDILIEID